MSATTLKSRRQRPREATPAAGARCDLATRGEHEGRRKRRPEVPTCQVRAAGTTEVVGWRARGAPGLLTLGTVALADAGIGVAVCFVYYRVARRSMLALTAWPICVGALVLAAVFQGGTRRIRRRPGAGGRLLRDAARGISLCSLGSAADRCRFEPWWWAPSRSAAPGGGAGVPPLMKGRTQ